MRYYCIVIGQSTGTLHLILVGGGGLVGGFYFHGEDLMYASQVDGDWVGGGYMMDGDQYMRDGNIVDGS